MKKKTIIKILKGFGPLENDSKLEQIDKEIFDVEEADYRKLYKARNISTASGGADILVEIFKKWSKVFSEAPEFEWVRPRVLNFVKDFEIEWVVNFKKTKAKIG